MTEPVSTKKDVRTTAENNETETGRRPDWQTQVRAITTQGAGGRYQRQGGSTPDTATPPDTKGGQPSARSAALPTGPEVILAASGHRAVNPGGNGTGDPAAAKPHCPAIAYSFSTESDYKDAYRRGLITKGEPYYQGTTGSTVHFAGSDKTVSREEYYRGVDLQAFQAPPSGGNAPSQSTPPKPEEVQARLAAWRHEMEVRAAQNSSPVSREGVLFSKGGRGAMGVTEPVVGTAQILTSSGRWLTSAGGYLPNAVSRTLGDWEKGADDTAARLEHTQQIAREAAGLTKDRWDWWATAGAVGSPANWVPVGRVLKGLKWTSEVLPAASRWVINNMFTRGMAGGGTMGLLKPTVPEKGETHTGERLKNTGEGAAWGAAFGPVFERVLAPIAQRAGGAIWQRVSGGGRQTVEPPAAEGAGSGEVAANRAPRNASGADPEQPSSALPEAKAGRAPANESEPVKAKVDAAKTEAALDPIIKDSPVLERLRQQKPEAFSDFTPETVKALETPVHRVKAEGAESIAAQGYSKPYAPKISPAEVEATESLSRAAAKHGQGRKPVQPDFDLARKGDPAYLDGYIDKLYRGSETATKELTELTRRIAGETGGEAGFRPGPKRRARVMEKVREYEGDASQLVDLAGSKITYNTLDDLYKALPSVEKALGDKLIRVKDRIRGPVSSGYGDILMNVKMSNGHIAEFRLHLKAVDNAAKIEHPLYQVSRSLHDMARAESRELAVSEEAIDIAIRQHTHLLYKSAFQASRR